MKSFRIPSLVAAAVVFLLLSEIPAADGQLRWPQKRKQEIEVRLIALAETYPRSSVFANDEVFVAEQELSKEESRFIKLVYDFLPYEPPLSDSGLNYSLLHKVQAVRDTSCDESSVADAKFDGTATASRAAEFNLEVCGRKSDCLISIARQARLRCYRTTSDDYEKTEHQPTNEIPY